MLLFWSFVFVISLVVLIKGADWLLDSAEKIGLAMGLSPFIVGVVIVGFGTSFPELISALVAVLRGVTEIVTANAIGSNIANILLVIGISAVIGRKLGVSKSLIDLDIPLLVASTLLFLGMAWDGKIVLRESVLLVSAYLIYLLYNFLHKDDGERIEEAGETLPSRADRRKKKKKEKTKKPKVGWKEAGLLVIGVICLIFGAKYLIESVVQLSEMLRIGTGVISLVGVAVGTSLPELLVSAKAAWQRKPEVALGNIFGSNVFNILIVVGLPGLFKTLILDADTFALGLPVLIAATFLFVISGISRRIHLWEGAMYLVFYVFFIGKLFRLL